MKKFLIKFLIFNLIFNPFSSIFLSIEQIFAGSLTVDFETTNWYTVTEWTWNLTTADKYEWNSSIVADNGWANNSSSCFEITRDSPYDSNISFYYQVSSEANYDFLRFYIDWTEIDKWSWDVTWSQYSKSVEAWNHTFKWCYTKDWSVSRWSDTAWVDIFYAEDVVVNSTVILDFETTWWYTVTQGTWNRTTAEKYEWAYSLVADNGWANNSSSCFTRDETFSDTWSIDFYYKVSSEANYDFLRFYIDDVEQNKWSWEIAWTNYTSNELSPWTYTFKWCYTKDGSVSNWSDTAWVDFVTKKIPQKAIFLEEITPVPTPTNDTTPDYTFYTPITWDISYSWSCTSSTTSVTSTWNVTITFDSLNEWVYNNCKVMVSNTNESSEWLPISEFVIDFTPPVITANIPQNEEVIAWDFQIIINHYDTWWIDINSANIQIYKWLWWDTWTWVTTDTLTNISTTSTWTTADFSWNDWKYKIIYSISDLLAQSSNTEIIFYVDTDTIVDFENTSWYTANPADWDRQTTKVYEWIYALESQNRTNNTTACFTINESIPWTWSVTFYYSVSSESNYDFLRFYIDWTEQDRWSWNIDWTLSPKYTFWDWDHELKWCYTKDGSVSNWDDRARVDYIVMQRDNKPTISEVTAIPTPTNDNTPNYTFNTSIDGNIAYSGSCDVNWNPTNATAWDNTITFWTLADWIYNDCQIQVVSSTDSTPWLSVSSFTIDTTWPNYNSFFPNINQIIPKNDFDITINYSDSLNSVDETTYTFNLYKWDSVNSVWNDITTNITNSWVTNSQANFTTSNLNYWKYKYDFSIKDNLWNQSNLSIEFYIDEPELIISTWSINIWKLNNTTNTFWNDLIVTVKTIWAPFRVKLQKNAWLTNSNWIDLIPYYDWNVWMWYDKNNDGNLSDFNDDIILSNSWEINTNGELNTYTYTLKIGAIIDKLQAAGNYTWKINFAIELDY